MTRYINITAHGIDSWSHEATVDEINIVIGSNAPGDAIISLPLSSDGSWADRSITVGDLRQLLAQRAAHEVTR